LGECASEWTQRYANGRTDADFAELVGSTQPRVNEARRVCERFRGLSETIKLSFSHYVAAVAWDDADECLIWADHLQASVREMKAWRRAQRGEDLTVSEQAVKESLTPDHIADVSEMVDEDTESKSCGTARKETPQDSCPERVAERAPQRAKRNAGQTTSGGGTGDSEAGTARKSVPPSPEPSDSPTVADLIRQLASFVEAQPDPERKKVARRLRQIADKYDPPAKWRPEDANIPKALDTPEFRSAWAEWCQYRRRRKPAITENAARKQLAKMAKHPVEICIESINESIANEYQGVFPEMVRGSRTGTRQSGGGDVYDPQAAASSSGD